MIFQLWRSFKWNWANTADVCLSGCMFLPHMPMTARMTFETCWTDVTNKSLLIWKKLTKTSATFTDTQKNCYNGQKSSSYKKPNTALWTQKSHTQQHSAKTMYIKNNTSFTGNPAYYLNRLNKMYHLILVDSTVIRNKSVRWRKIPEWTDKCLLTSDACLKHFWQMVHLYGDSPTVHKKHINREHW